MEAKTEAKLKRILKRKNADVFLTDTAIKLINEMNALFHDVNVSEKDKQEMQLIWRFLDDAVSVSKKYLR